MLAIELPRQEDDDDLKIVKITCEPLNELELYRKIFKDIWEDYKNDSDTKA